MSGRGPHPKQFFEYLDFTIQNYLAANPQFKEKYYRPLTEIMHIARSVNSPELPPPVPVEEQTDAAVE